MDVTGLTKTCTKCGQSFPRTRVFFHLHGPAVDGLKPRCKACQCFASTVHYRAMTPEQRAAYSQNVQDWGRQHRTNKTAYMSAWRERNPVKATAHRLVNSARVTGPSTVRTVRD